MLSDIFVRLVKMVIAPIVFLTVVSGMGGMGDLKKVGVIGAKALLYFEVVTTFALALGLMVATVLQPGVGIDTSGVSVHQDAAALAVQVHAPSGFGALVLHIVPDSVVGAFAQGDILPVLLFALLFGAVLARQPQASPAVLRGLASLSQIFFGIIDLVMKLAPLAAFGAMAYTVGQFGLQALWSQAKLMLAIYVTMFLFISVVLGGIARAYGFRLTRLLRHISAEIFLVLGTSSSESVLPRIMEKLQSAGCGKGIVGLVIPTGYSFNLDGTAIYLAMATLFIAQAYGVALSPAQLATTFGILMLTSKGSAGVTGSGFVTLAATLSALPDHLLPPEGIALVVGVDRFMSEGRAITNLIGNSVATVVLAKSEKDFVDMGVL